MNSELSIPHRFLVYVSQEIRTSGGISRASVTIPATSLSRNVTEQWLLDCLNKATQITLEALPSLKSTDVDNRISGLSYLGQSSDLEYFGVHDAE